MMPPLHIFLLTFTLLSMSLYICIIAIVFYNRKQQAIFRGSYFRLVISYFLADFIFFLEFTIMMRGRKFGLLNSIFTEDSALFTIVPPISNALHYYIKITVYIGQVMFAANRLSSALSTVHYENIWTPGRVWFLRLLQFTVPLVAVLPVSPAFNSQFWVRYTVYEEQNTLRLETDPLSTAIIAYIDAGCSFAANLLSLIMYIITFAVIRTQFRNNAARRKLQTLEIRLLISSIIVFLVLTLNTAMQIMTILANSYGLKSVMFVNDLSYPLIDCMYSIQPWALIITSSVIRQHLRGIVYGILRIRTTPVNTSLIRVASQRPTQGRIMNLTA